VRCEEARGKEEGGERHTASPLPPAPTSPTPVSLPPPLPPEPASCLTSSPSPCCPCLARRAGAARSLEKLGCKLPPCRCRRRCHSRRRAWLSGWQDLLQARPPSRSYTAELAPCTSTPWSVPPSCPSIECDLSARQQYSQPASPGPWTPSLPAALSPANTPSANCHPASPHIHPPSPLLGGNPTSSLT